MSDTHISLPYIYHQSPVYTLPCLSRPGGPHRRAEPQYKFVEEIITETTREIEMSEFEETGSEETEVGKDEQECAKRDRGGSEEEKDNKDGREEDGEQASDSEQNQVASVGNPVNGGDDGSPAEVDDGEKGQKSKEESEETEAAEGEGSGRDKNTQSKVLSESADEGGNEQHQKVAGNTKEEKEAAVTTVTDQKDLSSEANDLKPDVRAEEELLKKSDDGGKGDAENDGSKESVDETSAKASKESDRTQTEVQDEVHAPASETAEKTSGFPAETKSALFGETEKLSEKAQVPSRSAAKSEEKENSRTKEISESKAAKGGDEVAKSIQDAKHDSNKGRDKEPSLKSEAESRPEAEDQKPNGGDKTQTVRAEVPVEKPAAKAEIKGFHQGAPESSQVQKSKLSEVSEKINDPQGKTVTVESSKPEKGEENALKSQTERSV